ncbi:hypothetical protein NQ314_007491 [Rhamnusium bicolor]|uniref:Synembryn-A n=1 Tax=Rhamnusium bicolor TaxID=1586634 RepID=A0AAV8YQ09_9CUCU|nr:hypothetical protein NQ314_007491 [Rhamnusium bicolor]
MFVPESISFYTLRLRYLDPHPAVKRVLNIKVLLHSGVEHIIIGFTYERKLDETRRVVDYLFKLIFSNRNNTPTQVILNMGTAIEHLIVADEESCGKLVENFVQNSERIFVFPELNEGSKRSDLWKSLYNIAKMNQDKIVVKNCLIAIRILSREKYSLSELVTDDWLILIKKHTGLEDKLFIFDEETLPLALQAQMSLCNIIFNCRSVAKACSNNGILDSIVERINRYKDTRIPNGIKYFDMKLLFLISAICPDTRNKLKNELPTLVNILEHILKGAAEDHTRHVELPPIFLSDRQVDLVCETLKALFNLTVRIDYTNGEIMSFCIHLMELSRNFLLITSNSLDKTWMLRNNVINLLTNLPNECYKYLLIPVQEGHGVPKNLEFEGENMTAIYEILMFLRAKFNDEPKIASQHEVLSPVVTVLLKGAISSRPIRKFLRNQILPPLKDVHNRPEQGTTIRNQLCRLLTTPITQLRDLVAELLFVLCKKNVIRMIKYTGYGNAAGLFAQRGLLAGGHDKGEAEYSSDSDDSETEEYADHKHGINPVLGCYEAPHPNIMENMTEEQKEYEAMKLVELMDSLMKCGTIKPCRVGDDGKPQPIEHVLELQKDLTFQPPNVRRDSD